MSEVLENAMLSIVERLERTLPAMEKVTGVSAVENKKVSESVSNHLTQIAALIGALQQQAGKLEETAKRVGEMKIPEEVQVYNHIRHSTEPGTLKFLWIFFSVSVLLLSGAGIWVYRAVQDREAAIRTLREYQGMYKPERAKWVNAYVEYMMEKHPGDTRAYLKSHSPMPDN